MVSDAFITDHTLIDGIVFNMWNTLGHDVAHRNDYLMIILILSYAKRFLKLLIIIENIINKKQGYTLICIS